MTVKERLIRFAKSQERSVRAFEIKAGLTIGYINAIRVSIQPDKLRCITSRYPSLNTEWLMTGIGEMTKDSDTGIEKIDAQLPAVSANQQPIPIYEIKRAASLKDILSHTIPPADYISLPNLPKCDGAAYVYGDAMAPELTAGDIVVFKHTKDKESGIFFGRMYLVSLNIGGEHFIMLQYIQPSDQKNSIKLVSVNKQYPPKDIPYEAIDALAIVRASVKYSVI